MQRRTFIAGMGVMGVIGSLSNMGNAQQGGSAQGPAAHGAAGLMRASSPGTLKGEMLYRPLGRTGEIVSAIGMGGAHLGRPDVSESEAIKLIHAALDRGLNFMDNSWDYNGGKSEERMGKALSQGGYRQKAFLMTKLDGRTKEAAMQQINESLSRLKTDHVDLIQHHEIIRYDDPDRVFAQGGAIEATIEAKKDGKVRFIGFTGHKDPHIHLYMLQVAAKHGFHFDTVQMPLNVMDAHYRSFAHMVVPKAIEQQIGILGMKSMGDAIILKSKTVRPIECLHYAMNLPTSVVITGIDKPEILEQAFQAAKTFRLMDEQQVVALLARTQQAAVAGEYELFKTSAFFDSTAKHPEWLGGESPQVQKLAS